MKGSPKIIGLLMAWNEEPWIDYAIRNNLRVVDELILAEGYCGPDLDMKSHDRTREIMESYSSHPKVTAVMDVSRGRLVSQGKARTLTAMLSKARFNAPDNWVLLCAADMLYDDTAMQAMREEVRNTDALLLTIPLLYFAINFNHCVHVKGGASLLFRITDGMRICPTEKPKLSNGMFYTDSARKKKILADCPGFHYTWLKPKHRIIQRLQMYSQQRGKSEYFMKWFEEIYLKWDDSKAEELYKRAKEITGHSGFHYWREEKLDIFNGKHPQEVTSHPYSGIDVRTIE